MICWYLEWMTKWYTKFQYSICEYLICIGHISTRMQQWFSSSYNDRPTAWGGYNFLYFFHCFKWPEKWKFAISNHCKYIYCLCVLIANIHTVFVLKYFICEKINNCKLLCNFRAKQSMLSSAWRMGVWKIMMQQKMYVYFNICIP